MWFEMKETLFNNNRITIQNMTERKQKSVQIFIRTTVPTNSNPNKPSTNHINYLPQQSNPYALTLTCLTYITQITTTSGHFDTQVILSQSNWKPVIAALQFVSTQGKLSSMESLDIDSTWWWGALQFSWFALRVTNHNRHGL